MPWYSIVAYLKWPLLLLLSGRQHHCWWVWLQLHMFRECLCKRNELLIGGKGAHALTKSESCCNCRRGWTSTQFTHCGHHKLERVHGSGSCVSQREAGLPQHAHLHAGIAVVSGAGCSSNIVNCHTVGLLETCWCRVPKKHNGGAIGPNIYTFHLVWEI